MTLINGQETETVSVTDRGLQFGDGCFTTAMIENGRVKYPEDHLQRLAEGCLRLAIRFDDWPLLSQEMHQMAARHLRAVLKVIITRGSGGRGYSTNGCDRPARILSVSAWPEQYKQWQQQGISLQTSPIRLGNSPVLAGVKHLNRLEQILIRQHMDGSAAQEALVLDTQGNVIECGAANIFWRQGDITFTPATDQCGVDGTMRRRLIRHLRQSGYQCQIVTASSLVLAEADEVFICNAIMPVIPVTKIDGWHYSSDRMFSFLLNTGFTAG